MDGFVISEVSNNCKNTTKIAILLPSMFAIEK